jgi:hypothetical protein
MPIFFAFDFQVFSPAAIILANEDTNEKGSADDATAEPAFSRNRKPRRAACRR